MLLTPQPLGDTTAYKPIGGKVSLTSWNVWFDKWEREKRNQALLEELGRRDPDICCFQEVTPPFVRALQACSWLKAGYWISGTHHQEIGVVIVSRLKVDALRFCNLTTRMGRRLLVADFGGLRVGCAHFESNFQAGEVRRQQFSESLEYLSSSRSAVLAGDFNCAPDSEESEALQGAVDCWQALRPGEAGFTLDSESNFCAQKQSRSQSHRVRLDRILTIGRVEATQIEMMGVQPIGESLHSSDHFGLYVELRPDL
ncbi:MAG TPA: hypothetical protein EYO33_21155 [Phycisphaerales bacterium]|nr:hypothetical protein [Phycisphaerales bacterium]